MRNATQRVAKPFLKWAGGKAQLISQFSEFYPPELKRGQITKYVEPFIGGGAVFLNVVQNYDIQAACLNDINEELIIAYRVLQRDPERLCEYLYRFQKRYDRLADAERERYFYEVRESYNAQRGRINYERYSDNWILRAAQLIFLNRTCYNGLFRLNRSGEFNVPFGKYKNPRILDEDNVTHLSRILQIAEIRVADFESCENVIDAETFVYFDPPYRPISRTSNFTAYSRHEFGDAEQTRLSRFYARLDRTCGAKLMLSNSDPKNENPADDFFSQLYRDFNIHKVCAARMINSKASKRGAIYELLITNY